MLVPSDCPAYILAGGASKRFGSDKALVKLQDQEQLVRLKSALSEQGHRVEIVADKGDRFAHLGIPSLADEIQGLGPISGLLTALRERRKQNGTGWLLLIGCDQLVWRAEWFQQLSQQVGPHTQLVSFAERDKQGTLFPQPIPGLYSTALLEKLESQIDRREYSLRTLFADSQSATILQPDNPRDLAFNTQEELRNLLDHLDLP